MFKKLLTKLTSKTATDKRVPEGAPPGAGSDAQFTKEEFMNTMISFENQCQPYLELAERGVQHAETVTQTGKVDHALVSELERALAEIREAEIGIERTFESAVNISPAAQARFETAADKIADAHSLIENALNEIRMAKVDFDSNRDDEDDDDFDMD